MVQHEIPSDNIVCETLEKLAPATARVLLKALIDQSYSTRDSERAIQRCLDRGKIVLGSGLRLNVSAQLLVAA